MRHIPIIETEPITNPPSTEYERGKWYKRRGYLEKALRSFREAAQSAPTDKTSSGWKEVDLSWLEYGLLSMRMRSFDKSEEAFRTVVQHSGTYVQEALNQWAALLHMQGISDQTICERLLNETRSFPSSNMMVGRSLFYIGAYPYAAHCFAEQGSLYPDTCIQYVTCLIMTGQVSEAMQFIDSYLRDLAHHPRELPRPRTSGVAQLARIRQVCEWNISHSIPDRFIAMSETLELARAAVSFNMISIAEHLLTHSGDHAYYALICFLYDEGYRGLAISKLNQLEALPLLEQDSNSIKVCVIAAEHLYDQGRYDEAASLLEQLRLAHPGRTEIRFGEAACYLQSALISLSARLEEQYSSATARKEIEQYLDNINAALHVVENTNWHTTWSPAQKRRENYSPMSSLN
ncbi:tetratricopeptide repeat protein [Paenibacillus sp. 843]|uniref:tetratricopeptide repeat protein n=1 Tax=Paenibacillus sp. 843 TaxID=3341795 RepID=UPI0037262B52